MYPAVLLMYFISAAVILLESLALIVQVSLPYNNTGRASVLYNSILVKKVSRFKYATWNIRGQGEKEEELDKILNENDIKISVITESKEKLQGTKETEV
jgi:hypothetical protein